MFKISVIYTHVYNIPYLQWALKIQLLQDYDLQHKLQEIIKIFLLTLFPLTITDSLLNQIYVTISGYDIECFMYIYNRCILWDLLHCNASYKNIIMIYRKVMYFLTLAHNVFLQNMQHKNKILNLGCIKSLGTSY
jgi:hypothetical protein